MRKTEAPIVPGETAPGREVWDCVMMGADMGCELPCGMGRWGQGFKEGVAFGLHNEG